LAPERSFRGAGDGREPGNQEHRPGLTSKYGVDRLDRFECYDEPMSAITREKELKKWRRDWKITLSELDNPDWLDRYDIVAR